MPSTKKGALQFLRDHVDIIELLLLTHNDRDHAGGFGDICAAYSGLGGCALKNVCLLIDRPRQNLPAIQLAAELHRKGAIGQLSRLEQDGQPRLLWQDPPRGLSVAALYPDFAANAVSGSPNETSGIVRLSFGDTHILYTGDAPAAAWECVAAAVGVPIACAVATVPHHGAGWESLGQPGTHGTDFLKAVQCDHAVISVGTSNDYDHPCDALVAGLAHKGTTVLCTQITGRCCDDLESLRPGIRPPSRYCRSSPKEERTRVLASKNVACSGSVVVVVTDGHADVAGLDRHQTGVSRLSSQPAGHPMCRR